MTFVASMWDDALVTDLTLIEILREVGATAAFAISPSKHKIGRTTHRRGSLVSMSELKEFADFEVVNHTDNHLNLVEISTSLARKEIVDGRNRLEDIFGRKIPGFCYPHGAYSPTIVDILRKENVSYARTVENRNDFSNPLLLYPTERWNGFNFKKTDKRVILWGHTYEITDWNRIRQMYEFFVNSPDVKIVSFETIIKPNIDILI